MCTLLFSLPPAKPAYHSQRHAQAALVLLLSYAYDKLGVRKESFVARIGPANVRSIALFASLGSEVVLTVSVFDQVEMRVTDCVAQSWPVGRVREYPRCLYCLLTRMS
jgi:RimJ/RimL family protein N-acetyltransferase